MAGILMLMAAVVNFLAFSSRSLPAIKYRNSSTQFVYHQNRRSGPHNQFHAAKFRIFDRSVALTERNWVNILPPTVWPSQGARALDRNQSPKTPVIGSEGMSMSMRRFGAFLACLILAAPAFGAELVSICDVQHYNGIAEGDIVRIRGVAVANTHRMGGKITVLAEEGGGPYCSVAVFDNSISWPGPEGQAPCTEGAEYSSRFEAAQGNCVTVEGEVIEYYEATEVRMFCQPADDPASLFYEVSTSCFAIPDPLPVPTGQVMTEPYEWVLVELQCAEVVTAPDDYGLFQLDDGSGPCNVVGSLTYTPELAPELGDFFCRLAGVQDYNWGRFRVRPRDMTDIDQTTPRESCDKCGGEPPTYTPTNTPTSGDTPTPTPTQNPGGLSLDLTINKEACYVGGDMFDLGCNLTNNGSAVDIDLFVLLDLTNIDAGYYFWPTWTLDFDYNTVTVPPGSMPISVLEFTWPTGAGSSGGARFSFISAAFTHEHIDVAGLLAGPDSVTFCFE